MAYRTVSYEKCHRCGNANDRGSQRTCKSCHRIIQAEHRAKKKREVEDLEGLVIQLEEQLAVALARAVAAEAKLAVFGVSREVPRFFLDREVA